MQIVAEHVRALYERVLDRYDTLVLEGRSVDGEDLGSLFVSALPGIDNTLDLEPACQEMEARIRRYHLDVCLEHVQATDDLRPSQRLLARCFKGWPVSPKVMVRKLMSPETRRKKGKPVHGAQHVDLANMLFDRIASDARAEVTMTRAATLPEPETVRAAAHGHAVTVLAALLRAAGLRHRQIAQLLAAMGAVKDASPATQEKAVQRAATDGEALLDGQAPAKRRSLAYTHHPILEFLIAEESFLDALGEDPDGTGALLASIAPDLRAMKVRMALVDFSPTVVNAFQTLDREQWPPVLQRLCSDERTILADYGAERLSRTDAELALGRRGITDGAAIMRPVWRMFVASSLTRMALQDRAAVPAVLREVEDQDLHIDDDLVAAPDLQRAVGEAIAEYSRAYLWLDRVDLALIADEDVDAAQAALTEAERAGRGHGRLEHDLLLRRLTLEVKKNAGQPAQAVAELVDDTLRSFVAVCSTPDLAADNIRQYLAPVAPNVARVLAERSAQVKASATSM